MNGREAFYAYSQRTGEFRCPATGNPCGTDTVMVGMECPSGLTACQWREAFEAGWDANSAYAEHSLALLREVVKEWNEDNAGALSIQLFDRIEAFLTGREAVLSQSTPQEVPEIIRNVLEAKPLEPAFAKVLNDNLLELASGETSTLPDKCHGQCNSHEAGKITAPGWYYREVDDSYVRVTLEKVKHYAPGILRSDDPKHYTLVDTLMCEGSTYQPDWGYRLIGPLPSPKSVHDPFPSEVKP